MEPLVPSLIAAGWGAGVNAYATLILLNLGARIGIGDIPEGLERDDVLLGACVLYAIEFVTDKIPYVDNVWDTIHTAIRPAVGGVIGSLAAGDSSTLEQALAATGTGGTALASHGIKASLRVAINTSPEPVTTVIASLVEDGLVGVVVVLALAAPWIAAALAVLLLIGGFFLVRRLLRMIRGAHQRLKAWWSRPYAPPPHPPPAE